MTSDDVVRRVTDAAFGRPLVTNSLRGLLVEAIVSAALEPEWHWCGMDWGNWDFERADGLRLEVKQSSYRQTWSAPSHGKVSPGFDIRARSGRWEGSTFIAEPGRAAHIYVFAFHGVKDDSADHRDPAQWVFHVVRTEQLPPVKRISLSAVQRLSLCVPFDGLSNEVGRVASPRLNPGPTYLRGIQNKVGKGQIMITLTTPLWLWTSAQGSWHFVTIPADQAVEVKLQAMAERRGFGSVRVVARIGEVEWRTSIFPQKTGDFILPVKAEVRAKAGIAAGDEVTLTLEVA